MGYIKKLKNNELVGGTDKTTIYPVTSTEAVFEEITNGNESSFKSQKTINKEQQDELDDHEERIQAAEAEDIKSITINGSTKKFEVDDENNVDLTIYTVDNDPEMPSIASNVEDLRNMVGTSTPVLETSHKTRIETLEGGESVTGSVENKIKTKVDSINSSYQDDNNEYVKYSMTQTSGEVTNFNIDETSLKNAITSLNTSISGTNIIIVPQNQNLPSTGNAGTIYRKINAGNTYTDYMYSNGWKELATHDTSNEQAQVAYYTCVATGSGAQATKQFVSNGSLEYTPSSGGHIKILMGEANTATGTIYLQYNTDATNTKKPLYYNGEPVSTENTWGAGETIAVYYDPSANNNAGAYFASNAQGGGGKAEKIKYDNSQSSLAAENVQEALDEMAGLPSETITAADMIVGKNGFLINAQTWMSQNTFGYRILKIDGKKGVLSVSANTDVSIFAILNTLNEAKANSALGTFANGYTERVVQTANTTETYALDGSCNFVIFNYKLSEDNMFPLSISFKESAQDAVENSEEAITSLEDKVTISEQVGYSDMSVVSDTYNIGETTWSKTTNTIGTMVYNVPNEYKGGRLKVIANSTGSWFAMMNTYTTPSNGQSLGVFAEGYTGRTMMGAAVTGTYEIPHDCNYILFTYQRTNDSIFPFRIKLERDIKDFVGNDVTSVPISDSDLMQGVGNYIINTNTWLSNNNFGYKILDMSHFVGSIRVTSNTDVSIFAFLATMNVPSNNASLGTFANGYTGRIVQDANTTEEYYVDGSCNYAIFNYKIVNDNVFPVSIELVSSSGEIAKRNSSEIQKLKREGADEMIATQVMRNAMCLSPTNYKFAFGAFVFMKDGNAYISYFTDVNPDSDRPNLQGHDMFMAEVNLADNSIQNHNENVTSVLDNEGNVLTGYRGGDLKSPLVIGNKIYVLQQIYKDNQKNPYAAYTIWDEPSEYWTGYSVRCATLEYTDTNNVSHSVIFSLANFRQMVVDMGWVNTYYQPGYDMFDDCAIAYDSNTSKFYKVMCTVNANFGGIPLVVLESSDFATWTVIGTVGSGKYKSSEISIAIKDSKIYISARTLTTVLWFVYDIANGVILENGEFNVGGVLSRPYTLIYNNNVYMAINVFPTVYGTMENYHSLDLDCRPEVNLYKFVDDKPILFRVINNPTGINYHAWCETPPLICEGQTLPITAQSGIYCAYSEDRRRIFRRQYSQVSFADVTALFAENEKIV